VVVLTGRGGVAPARGAYDRKVVGVVAGAGSYRPGLVLDHRPGAARRLPVSVMGKVACWADARYGPIEVGDLLTTSPTPGCAMRADDPGRAAGAVVGKALTPMRTGRGLVDVLIALQ
jgi:hypothetical protein